MVLTRNELGHYKEALEGQSVTGTKRVVPG